MKKFMWIRRGMRSAKSLPIIPDIFSEATPADLARWLCRPAHTVLT
jgi:hypothetical protein